MIKINVILVHGIELSTFTEKLREIGEGPKFALYVLTRTAPKLVRKLKMTVKLMSKPICYLHLRERR